MGGFTIPRGYTVPSTLETPGVTVSDFYGGQRAQVAPDASPASTTTLTQAVSQAVNDMGPANQRMYRDFIDRSALDYAEIEQRKADSMLPTVVGLLAAAAMPAAAPALGSLLGVGSTVGGALIGGATAAARGDSIVEGVLTGGLSGGLAGVDIGQVLPAASRATQMAADTGVSALSALSAAGPAVMEAERQDSAASFGPPTPPVFTEEDFRSGGVIPEQPFETQAPVVEPQQEAGGGGATPAPAPTTSTPTTMPDQQVDPEQPYRYEGNGRFVNVLTGDVINRNVPDTFVIGDFYGLPQNVEANIPDSGAAEEVVDVFTPIVLPGTLDPDLFDVEPDAELPAQTPSEAAQEPLPQQDVGEDTTAAEGGQGAGEGAGEGSGEGDGSGEGAGTGMMSTAATQFEPEWTKLFKYTKLTPYQKKALRPFMGTLTQARGMLS